jgi:riboflavin kinase/FMN adenylyltransferase
LGFEELRLDGDTVVTIGTFDGVHRGHQHLLRSIVDRAREAGLSSAALTFHPHPRIVLRGDSPPTYLSTIDERAAMLETLGLDILLILPFSLALSLRPAEEFVRDLCANLRMRELWVGGDFALGKNRSGDTESLRRLATDNGFELKIVAPLSDGAGAISSTRVRELLSQGRVTEAAELLGRLYAISGTVVHGVRRGRDLGFRTANLRVPARRVLPANGVYAVWVTAGDQHLGGVANVGVRPSFAESDLLLEAHIFDFVGDLYGEPIQVEFVEYLREEQRFASAADLVAQVERDKCLAKRVLGLGVTASDNVTTGD